ncbi:ATP-grasp domain-containing protein [bacterium]|nr:ATP-grasp domain-containing protein [bacterium]
MNELAGKKLLIIGATKTECDIVRYAKNKGIYTIVADYKEDSPAKLVADKPVLINALDVDALVDFCRKEKVDGVITGFVDILLRPYMEVCKKLDLPCYITEKMLSMSTNKIDFKETCDRYNVPVPKTYLTGNQIDKETLGKIKYPVFVKPLDGSGSRGAGVCKNETELFERFKDALSYSASGNAIIEDYISGREFLLDYIAVDGEFRLLSIFDRFMASDRGSAVNYSTISMSPSKAVDYYLENINDTVVNMFKKEGFTDGVLFMQGYYDGNRIMFFEMGCRLGGSYFNHEQACLGYNAMDMIINYALTGKMVNDIRTISKESAKYKKYALDCNYLLKGCNETVAEIRGMDEVEAMPECVEIQKYHEVGYHYDRERIVDIPIMVAEIVLENKEQVIEKVNYINSIFDVFNPEGKSILMDKLDPKRLFE